MVIVVIVRGSAVAAADGAGGWSVEGASAEELTRGDACGSLVALAVPEGSE